VNSGIVESPFGGRDPHRDHAHGERRPEFDDTALADGARNTLLDIFLLFGRRTWC